MYAKLVDGLLYQAPPSLPSGDVIVFNPPASLLEEAGYKLVVFVEPPSVEEGYHLESYWRETAKRITQTYEIVKDPDDIDEIELVNILFGEGFEI